MVRAVVSFVSALACAVVSGCDQPEGGMVTAEPEAVPEVASQPTVEPVSLGSEIVVSLACSALSTNEGFTREITLSGGGGSYTWSRGAKDTARYEYWEMKIDESNGFTVTGEYIEGGPDLKPLSLAGAVTSDGISGEGMRGPRKCTIKS